MTEHVGTAALVYAGLGSLVNEIMKAHPDGKHNQGRFILESFLWDQIESIAKGKSADAWDKMEANGVFVPPNKEEAGNSVCGESPKFVISAKVSEKVKRFNGDELAKLLNKSKYKVPVHTAKEFIDKAKVGSTPTVTLRIVER